VCAPPPSDVEGLLRALAPRVLGALARRTGDFGAAEDAVQEALLAAHLAWTRDGAPANPSGWLYRTALRRLADQRDSETARRERELARGTEEPHTVEPSDETLDERVPDDTLALFFLCCHPALTPPSAIALTLRAVGGLTTAEIARAFLVPESTMAQRISRAKETIAGSGLHFSLPRGAEWNARLETVLHVLYLLFNEGYVASAGRELVRVDLTREAIRLARLLHTLQPEHAEAQGLLALLLLTDARHAARVGALGELVPLDEQDRARWDLAAIAEGAALVSAALARGAVGSYQIQAAIAALHGEAPDVASTDWPQILALYGLLERVAPNPFVSLSRAIARAMVHGPEAGLADLDELERDARVAGHYRLAAVRAHLNERQGARAEAERHYRAAAAGTANLAERHYLLTRAERLAGG
jgi:RNA polymerase sigma factor (sigma-70 family)